MLDRLPLGPDESQVSSADVALVRAVFDHLAERIYLKDVKIERRAPALAS
jgi:hypothetical protein